LLALADDVDLEVHARDRRLHARRLVELLLDVLVGQDLVALDHDLLGRRLHGLLSRRLGGLLGSGLLRGSLGLLGSRGLLGLVDLILVLGHVSYLLSISAIGCGCCAACGWSGPA